MDRGILGGLINSISRFMLLVSCLSMKTAPVLKDLRNLIGVLKLMKPLLDQVNDSQIPLDKELLKAFEELDVFVNEAREILEKMPQQMSNICRVVQCQPLVMKIKISSMETCCNLRKLLQSATLGSLLTTVQHCIQELQSVEPDQTWGLIEDAIKCQRDGVVPSPRHVMQIVESLGLTSKQELLMERIYLEKEVKTLELRRRIVDVDLINQVIEVVAQINNCMAKAEQFGATNGLPIPSYFRCPLSLELMSDPVILASGQTYERCIIQKWIDHGLSICPKTQQTLAHTNLIPNYTVKALIANWCEENSVNLRHSVESNNISYHSSYFVAQKDSSPGISFCILTNRDYTQRTPNEVGDRLDQATNEASSQSGEDVPYHVRNQKHEVVSGNMNSQCRVSVEQQPYCHSRTESVASTISTIDLSKTDDRIVTSECPDSSSSNKDVDLHPWFSTGEFSCNRNGKSNDLRSDCSLSSSRSDDLTTSSDLQKLVESLKSQSSEVQAAAALELRLLAKHSLENRVLVAKCGAISPLISLLYSKVRITQENAVTALLNLSINDDNKTFIAEAGAIEPLIHVLTCGSTIAQENSAAALFSLSALEEYKIKIGRSGAIKALVDLLGYGTLRGKKDAATALFNLSIFHENKARIVQAGAVAYLVKLMDPEKGMVDKAVALLANVSTIPEGRLAISREGAIPLLVEVVETGSQRGKENAASVLLQLCINNQKFCSLVLQEGAVPPLIALSQIGTPRAKEKAQQILNHFRSQREGAVGRRRKS